MICFLRLRQVITTWGFCPSTYEERLDVLLENDCSFIVHIISLLVLNIQKQNTFKNLQCQRRCQMQLCPPCNTAIPLRTLLHICNRGQEHDCTCMCARISDHSSQAMVDQPGFTQNDQPLVNHCAHSTLLHPVEV